MKRNKMMEIICLILVGTYIGFLGLVSSRQISIPTIAQKPRDVAVLGVMYHQVSPNEKGWGEFSLSPQEFEEDIIYLKKQGYETVVIQDLIDHIEGKKELPKKPVLITIDDGFLTDYTQVLPILEKHDAKAVFSIVGAYTDLYTKTPDQNEAYAHINWDMAKKILESGHGELQNHSYNMHNFDDRKGSTKMSGETVEEYKAAFRADAQKMQQLMEEKLGVLPTTYTYPYGLISKESIPVIQELGFLSSFSVAKGINHIGDDLQELYQLKRFNRPHGVSSEDFFSAIIENYS